MRTLRKSNCVFEDKPINADILVDDCTERIFIKRISTQTGSPVEIITSISYLKQEIISLFMGGHWLWRM